MLIIVTNIEDASKITFIKKAAHSVAIAETVKLTEMGEVCRYHEVLCHNAEGSWINLVTSERIPVQVEDILNAPAIDVINNVIDLCGKWEVPVDTTQMVKGVTVLTIIGGSYTAFTQQMKDLTENLPDWALCIVNEVAERDFTTMERMLIDTSMYFYNALVYSQRAAFEESTGKMHDGYEDKEPMFTLIDPADLWSTSEEFPEGDPMSIPDQEPFVDTDRDPNVETQDTSPGFQFMNQAPLVTEDDYLG